MPQMMPLMWMPLFVIFTLLLMISFSKIYFVGNKILKVEAKNHQKFNKNMLKWTW